MRGNAKPRKLRFAISRPAATPLVGFCRETHTSGQLLKKLPIRQAPDSMALSPDGKVLALGFSPVVELWDLTTSQKVSQCVGHKELLVNLAFSPDGKLMASGSIDNTAKIWHVPSGKLKFDLGGYHRAAWKVAFSPDGRTLATLGDGLKLWNVTTGLELMTLSRPASFGGVLSFSSHGGVLGHGQNTIELLRAPSFAEIKAAETAKARNR